MMPARSSVGLFVSVNVSVLVCRGVPWPRRVGGMLAHLEALLMLRPQERPRRAD
jgi:hypothetical protein